MKEIWQATGGVGKGNPHKADRRGIIFNLILKRIFVVVVDVYFKLIM